MALQQGVWDFVCIAAGDVQKSLVDAPEIVDLNVSLIFGRSKRSDLAKLGSTFVYYASHESRRRPTRAASDSRGVLMRATPRSSAPAFPGAADPSDHTARCYLNVMYVLISADGW